eukprot:TRINITY_DN1645_c0_g1_i1.p1 TRINITY_DN1645_c0_g1~~TRINITY_DN1645_c0_g1_i1.p1  ORF type:complete len:218 (+),score=23.67 TRINITY_DN1645_c0_g1_i1:43-696(+)
MRASAFVLMVLLAMAVAVAAKRGVDVSEATSESSFACLKKEGYDYAIVRAYQSFGRPDPAGPISVDAAWKAGMAHVDVYMFPCPKCASSAATQVKEAIEYLASHRVKYGTFWLDIEGPQYWSSNKDTNKKFIEELLEAVKAHGQHASIYTSASQWIPIVGSWDAPGRSGVRLWYANYDSAENFNDFREFGGWRRPSYKQYRGSVSLCGAGVDLNWNP